ncbi:hypothetical protein C8Q75DRAFT_737244 [Abortiporus biennis]|nr:hypothetical protein C8Q75DRAFT_737244 [Abortiporus biennis]
MKARTTSEQTERRRSRQSLYLSADPTAATGLLNMLKAYSVLQINKLLDVKCSTRTVIINVHNPHRDKATENQLHDAAIQDLFSDFRPFFRGRRVCPTSNILSFRQIQPSIPDRSEVIKGIRGFTVVGGLVQDIIKMSHHLELFPCGALTR